MNRIVRQVYISVSVTCFEIIHNVIGDQLYPRLWSWLENLGFLVLAQCYDGLPANRKFFRLHDTCSSTAVYKVINPYPHDEDKRYMSDPPHLVKTVRNCWANKKRKLWVRNTCIMCMKLKYEHVHLTSYSKMCIDLAAQVKMIGVPVTT